MAAAFEEEVSARVGTERIVSGADEARTLNVTVRRQGDGYLGTLSVGKSLRTLRANTCQEAAKALALATAIVIEAVARACASSSLIPAVNQLGTLPVLLSGSADLKRS